MNEEMVQQMMAAERLAAATETLDRVLGKLDAQQEMLNAKVDRIVAAVEESVTQTTERHQAEGTGTDLQQRVVQLEKSNADLKAQASRSKRGATWLPSRRNRLSAFSRAPGRRVWSIRKHGRPIAHASKRSWVSRPDPRSDGDARDVRCVLARNEIRGRRLDASLLARRKQS